MSAIEPLPSSTLVLLGLDVRAADEPAGADDQRLVQDDQAAENGHFAPARAVEPRVEALGGVDDPAVRVAQRDGDRIATAHQHAFDEGLAAVRVVGHRREVYRRCVGRAPGIDNGRPSGPAGPGVRLRRG